MSRRREEESSLELLLDTMCNTFGGVMFIAISLAVIVAGRTMMQKLPAEQESSVENVKKLQEEVAALETVLSHSKAEQKDLDRIRKLMEQDERMKLLGEIVILEEKLRNLNLQTTLFTRKAEVNETAKLSLQLKIGKLKKQMLQLTLRKEELNRKLSDEKDKTESLRRQIRLVSPRELTFHVLTERKEAPFFIILRKNSYWCVGPRITGADYEGCEDVETQKSPGSMQFTVKPEKARSFCTDQGIAPEFLQFLTQLEKDRIPKFIVDGNTAREFFTLRQELKKQGIPHGFTTQKDNKSFSIKIVRDTRYEY